MQPQTQSEPLPSDPLPAPRPPFNEVSVLFPLLSMVTVVYLGMLVADFFLHGSANSVRVPPMMMPVYISLLGAYAADKEIRRWVGTPEPPRKGVVFVHLWVLLFAILGIINFFRTDYPLPSDLGKVVLQVVGVFCGSRASKYLHERRSAIDPEEQSEQRARILEVIRTKGKIVRAEVIEMFGIGKTKATYLLEAMVNEGLIRRVGETRGIHYIDGEKK